MRTHTHTHSTCLQYPQHTALCEDIGWVRRCWQKLVHSGCMQQNCSIDKRPQQALDVRCKVRAQETADQGAAQGTKLSITR